MCVCVCMYDIYIYIILYTEVHRILGCISYMHYMFAPHQLQENAYFMRVPPIYPRDLHHHPCSQRRRWSVENRPSCPGRSWAVQQTIYIQHPHAYVLAQASDVTFVTCYKWYNMASDSSDVTCYKYISLILYNHMWAM